MSQRIQEQLAKEFGKSPQLIKLVIDNFWIAFKKALTNPIDSKGRIVIPHLGSFVIRKGKVEDSIRKSKDMKFTKLVSGTPPLDFYENLQHTLTQNERQSSKKSKH